MADASMWVYLSRQAKGQLGIIYHTEDINKVIKKRILSKKQEEKINLIKEIKIFSEQKLGLKKTSNYTSFYDQKGKPILWMLTACEAFQFKEKTWNFPMIGTVSYKGFFDYHLALIEANELKKQSYDIYIGKVSAWSTLGILSDPILSSMLDESEGELAELIIHELTHSTIYFKDQVDFNENFASFIGRMGAIQFISHKYGKESKQMLAYIKNKIEQDSLKLFVLRKKEILNQFYTQMPKAMSIHEKEKQKVEKIGEIIDELYNLPIYNLAIKTKIAERMKISGNAYFMSYHRYDSQYEMLYQSFSKHHKNIKKFIEFAAKQEELGISSNSVK